MEEWNLWGTTAPGVGAELGRCGGGGRRGGRPAPRWLDVTKAYQKSILWLGDSYTHPLVTIKPTNVFLGKGQQNRRGAGSPPSSWDLDGGWGGGRRHEALITKFVRTTRFIAYRDPLSLEI